MSERSHAAPFHDASSVTGPLDVSRFSLSQPSVARCYDAMLGGKDNYAVDRAAVAEIRGVLPSAPAAARESRQWLIRVVRYLAGVVGIDQFLDCGSGLPTAENTHEVAQRANPEAMVVYIDHDPVVVAHGKALLDDNEHTHIALADFTRVEELCQVPAVARNIDFSRPVALLHGSSLHHVPDEEDPWGVVRRSLAGLASGSYLAVSHMCVPRDPEMAAVAERVQALWHEWIGSGRFRTEEEITALLAGTELVEPGLVRAVDWWPDGPPVRGPEPAQELVVGAVGRKP